MEGDVSFFVIAAGICSGAIIGVTMVTNSERESRPVWKLVLFQESSWLGSLLNVAIRLMVLAMIMTAVAVGILEMGNTHPLTRLDSLVFLISWFTGMAIAKWVRFSIRGDNA